jgi:NADPH:quinone reductase-like Zn-dependent oxidoreductase
MKAIILKQNGGVENLFLSEIEKPKIQPSEVLVRVKAISINPVDAFARQNKQTLKAILKPKDEKETIILGWDISGIVVETGKDVKDFKKGDDVFGMVNFVGQGKAYAEFVASPANQLAIKPKNISYEEAAAATLAALTAWQALVNICKVKKGDKVLIHAAAGGVGHYAVQIAKSFGAYIAGTASSPNKEFLLKLGANEFIDYTSEKFEDRVKNADIVLDSIPGSDHLLRSLECLKKGGKIVSLKSSLDENVNDKIKEKEIIFNRVMVRSNGDDMKQIAKMLEDGQIHSHVSQKFSFKDLPKAHQQIETGRTRGKIVVVI